jgi:hypothetical protein
MIPWLVVLAAGVLVLPARAQINGGAGATAPPAAPVNPGVAVGGSVSGPGYGGYAAVNTRAQGYLNGVANVTTANAEYQQTMQQAKLGRQEAIRSVLATRRATIEERQYELSQMPTEEQEREKRQLVNIRRARNSPPLSEIWSGSALNELLRVILDGQSHGLTGPQVPLTYEVLRHINLTSGTTYAGTGLLRDGGKLSWPAVLRKSMFAMERNQLNEQFYKAVQQAFSGQVDADLLDSLESSLNGLNIAINSHIDDISPTQLVQASRYARELKEAYQVLQQNDGAKVSKPSWSAQGSTVTDLVSQMGQQGLRFAPATSGDESAYTSLHRSLVTYDAGVAHLADSVASRGSSNRNR